MLLSGKGGLILAERVYFRCEEKLATDKTSLKNPTESSNGEPQCGDPRFCVKHCEEEVQPTLTEKDMGRLQQVSAS